MYTCACKNQCMGTANHPNLKSPLTQSDAQEVARLMGALSTASRVRILARLRVGECPVGDLSAELEMEQPAVSHQLRVLRDLGLVVGRRSGRHVVYVASLLDEALRHIDHVSSAGAVPRRNGSASHL
jgi:DNA-binding transcriptional ArsR family regulator